MSTSRSGLLPLVGISGLLALVMGTLVLLRAPDPGRPEIGAPAPDFELPDLKGAPVALGDQLGRVVFVNFWATWCPPCRDEAPSLERLYAGLGGEGFEILAVSIDAGGAEAEVEDFRREFDLTFPILLDPDKETYGVFGATGVPETYLIDRQGRLAERFIGPRDWDEPRYASMLRRMLGADEPRSGAPGG